MRIVIVEDEIKIREGMAKLIGAQTEHTIVGEAQNGKEGLELVLRFKPDLIITDIQMPVMDGLEMIKVIHDMDIHIHTVILSGYSEFEYAKKAIQFGVDDYLLKPLAAEDVQDILKRISERIEIEEQKAQGTRESFIRDILYGNIEENNKVYKKLAKICEFEDNMKYLLIMGYLGSAPATYKNDIERNMESIQKKYSQCMIYTFYQENMRTFYCLVAGTIDMEEFKRSFYQRLIHPYEGKREQPAWAEESFLNCQELKHVGNNLNEYLSYGIALGNDAWINAKAIKEFKPEVYIYPSEISSSLKNGICKNNNEEISKAAQDFIEYLHKHSFDAYNIRQSFLKMYYLISDLLSEIDKGLFDQLKSTNALQLIGEAVTWMELETAYLDVIHVLTSQRVKREDISNYTIKRAINYIREHYQEGITLEEVSRKLEITPEYLSTLFNREMNINFSAFLKQFRISHAKRLLKGSDMKIYEISEKVGYSDPKYFTRVFKEEQGISPGEYRQLN